MTNRYPLLLTTGFLLVILTTMACNLLGFIAASTPDPTQIPATISLTVIPSPSETLLPPTPESTATATPPNNVEALVNVESINLRDGPGTIFSIIATASKGTLLKILHKAPGDDWVFVQTPQGKSGWASVAFISPQGSIQEVVVKNIDFAYIISGKVMDETGSPIEGINIAVSQQGNTSQRTDANSNSNGEFYAYLPYSKTGIWDVSVVGISCTSHIVTPPCEVSGHFSPDFISLNLSETISPVTFQYIP